MKEFTLNDELKLSFNYFMECSNFNELADGYGLTMDNYKNKDMSSLAASGFMLASLAVGVNESFISFNEAKEKAIKSIVNIYNTIDEHKGLLVHFASFKDGKRINHCEYSTIDTVLFIAGVIVCSSFFKDKTIDDYLNKFLQRIDWNYYLTTYSDKNVVRMAYNDYNYQTKSNYKNEEDGFIFQWHMYAEQLIMYLLIASDERVDNKKAIDLFNDFRRDTKKVLDYEFVRCPTGSLFTYQFSHCFFDFKSYLDCNNYNWFLNSKYACLDNYLYCKNNTNYKTFKEGLWGVSASDGPHGYNGYGIPPYDYDNQTNYNPILVDGTIAPYCVISSLPFIEDIVLETFSKIISVDNTIGKYGLKDAINLDFNYIDDNYFGIDKGSEVLMIENYKNGLIWNLFTNHPLIQKAIKKLDFKKVGDESGNT